MPESEVEAALLDVWAAALDAQAITREEGGTEEQYLAKQRHHIGHAESRIRNVLADPLAQEADEIIDSDEAAGWRGAERLVRGE